jgi:hypothetical protein
MFQEIRLRRILLILAAGLGICGLVLYLLFLRAAESTGEMLRYGVQEGMSRIDAASDAIRRSSRESLPGELILKTYASLSTRPEDDLQAMAHVFSNLQLLVKGDAPFRMGANEEFAAALMGQNAAKEVFLKAPHACLNEKGQIVDRWGSPLFFHVRDRSRIDIRSAGPDREMWTADDLQRQHEGEFFSGAGLPEPPRR